LCFSQAKQQQQEQVTSSTDTASSTITASTSPTVTATPASPTFAKVTVTQVVTKAMSPGPESLRPKTEGEAEFTEAYEELQHKLSAFENNMATDGNLVESDFTDNIEANIQVRFIAFLRKFCNATMGNKEVMKRGCKRRSGVLIGEQNHGATNGRIKQPRSNS
jgi:hypothetical protein